MQLTNQSAILIETAIIRSEFLEREVQVDLYLPKNISDPDQIHLLLINDGQAMKELSLKKILSDLQNEMEPVVCVAIHASEQRKMEYGVAIQADYLGRGAKAGLYTSFVIQELMLFISQQFRQFNFKTKAFSGFSLGGLMALDIVWNYPELFDVAGIFSGSLWWRNLDDKNEKYSDETHRIMHQQIKNSSYHPGQRFYFTTGSLDEVNDRNANGIIDSIDDTISLISDLERLGYKKDYDIKYVNYPDGKHDILTWSRAMPGFLSWAFRSDRPGLTVK